jgi:hypothetical protein
LGLNGSVARRTSEAGCRLLRPHPFGLGRHALSTGVAALGVCIAGLAATAGVGRTLVEDRTTAYRIVVADDAIGPERHAAEELALFLAESTGAEFPIVSPRIPTMCKRCG